MDHGFAMPPLFPQEFLNRICTWSYSLKGCSIRFLDDWWTWFIESQLLYSQWNNWVTLWANWLLCYGMHHGKATWSLDCLSQTAIRYHVAPMKHLMAVSSLQEMALLISLRLLDWEHHNQVLTINPECGSSAVWRSNICVLAQETREISEHYDQ